MARNPVNFPTDVRLAHSWNHSQDGADVIRFGVVTRPTDRGGLGINSIDQVDIGWVILNDVSMRRAVPKSFVFYAIRLIQPMLRPPDRWQTCLYKYSSLYASLCGRSESRVKNTSMPTVRVSRGWW